MFVKLCGLKTGQDVDEAVRAGADAVGFVLSRSVRQVSAEVAADLAARVPAGILTVGVVAGTDAEEAADLSLRAGLQALQLHGDYSREAFGAVRHLPLTLLRATSLKPGTDTTVGAYGEEMLLLDSSDPGSGHQWDLAALERSRPQGRWLLAGGLSPDNVAQAIAEARPWGVDVSSGIESSRGVKDAGLMRAFVAAVRTPAGG